MARPIRPPRKFHFTIGGVSAALVLTTIAIVVAHGVIPLLAFLAAPPLLVLLLRMGWTIEESLVLIATLVVIIALSMPGVPGHSRGTHQERSPRPTSFRLGTAPAVAGRERPDLRHSGFCPLRAVPLEGSGSVT